MSQVIPIGTTKGPGETPHEYTVITPDRERTAKSGEFVYYETVVDGQPRCVLGRITGRQPVRLFPDSFLADPGVPPEEVAALIGYTGRDHGLFELTVGVLGYYDETLGDFINPRLPPRAGTPICSRCCSTGRFRESCRLRWHVGPRPQREAQRHSLESCGISLFIQVSSPRVEK